MVQLDLSFYLENVLKAYVFRARDRVTDFKKVITSACLLDVHKDTHCCVFSCDVYCGCGPPVD